VLIKVTVKMGLIGCEKSETFKIDDDASDDEIEEQAKATVFEMIQWTWKNQVKS
jgi:hypothetical protein